MTTAPRLAEAQGKTDPKTAETIPKIRQFLSIVNDLARLTSGPFGMGLPFLGGGKSQPPGDLFEAFQAMMEEQDLDFDDLDDDFDDDDDDYWD